ncbi:hypothetical protein K1719_042969 [Acacia pycnantha]|nr:hypothetical protein K1719_042969 [Acacia pycnantha]
MLCRRKNPDVLFLDEMKCTSIDKFRCLTGSGFDGMAWVPSVGRSGDIVAAWRKENIDITTTRLDRQFIHLKCSVWSEISQLASSILDPWVLIGDFNDVASASEKTGGAEANFCRMALFSDWIQQCKLMDLGAVGPRYTWKGPISRGGRHLFERLDRGLANEAYL